MTNPSIASDLIERSRKLLEGITPGPWCVDEGTDTVVSEREHGAGHVVALLDPFGELTPGKRKPNARLIAAAPAIIAEQAEALSQLTREVDEMRAAIAPFIEAGAHGVAVADAVRAANLPKAGLSPLMCPEIPAGVSAAQDRISFADWKSVAALSRSSGRVSDATA